MTMNFFVDYTVGYGMQRFVHMCIINSSIAHAESAGSIFNQYYGQLAYGLFDQKIRFFCSISFNSALISTCFSGDNLLNCS